MVGFLSLPVLNNVIDGDNNENDSYINMEEELRAAENDIREIKDGDYRNMNWKNDGGKSKENIQVVENWYERENRTATFLYKGCQNCMPHSAIKCSSRAGILAIDFYTKDHWRCNLGGWT